MIHPPPVDPPPNQPEDHKSLKDEYGITPSGVIYESGMRYDGGLDPELELRRPPPGNTRGTVHAGGKTPSTPPPKKTPWQCLCGCEMPSPADRRGVPWRCQWCERAWTAYDLGLGYGYWVEVEGPRRQEGETA